MPLLKDNEREQLRQLVKACLLEISKLKIELKKCQTESKNSGKLDTELVNKKNQEIEELKQALEEKDGKIAELMGLLDKKNDELEELQKIKRHFDALTARPKKDLTSFQSQVYQLLNMDKCTTQELYEQILDIGFKELSFDNFNSILRNLERKGYFKSFKENETTLWQKIDK
jgi:predicted RNase H-like nuclease (RuvC/YqgF family)